jgi:hypothetical protein
MSRNEDPLKLVCANDEAMEIAAKGGRCKKIGRAGNGAGGERGQTAKDNLENRSAPTSFNFRIFG